MAFWLPLALSALGLGISLYVLSRKLLNRKLVCFLGKDCDAVVRSRYGWIFGIPNEFFGVFYYGGVSAGAFLLWKGIAGVAGVPALAVLQGATFLAFLFSLYLTLIQFFVLKKWCDWCLATAVINFVLFLLLFNIGC